VNIVAEGGELDKYEDPDGDEEPEVNAYTHALVTQVSPTGAEVRFGQHTGTLSPADVAWTKTKPKLLDILHVGDVVYIKVLSLDAGGKSHVSLEQDSGAEGALVAIDNATGEIKAMVGGRDFNVSKFNRATQALRQVGSSFKPYVYTAAIDQGASPDDTILDAPVTFQTASGPYVPHNYDAKFEGTITLRRALAQSRNIPALKLADRLGIKTVIEYAHRFGITANIPAYLPVALGSAEITPLDQTSAFSVFPNDGVHVAPRYITRVTDYEGRILEEDFSDIKDAVSSHTARIMTSMLREVVLHGTAVAAAKMPYPLAGKTGTTNDFTDAWFVGFSPSLTCGVWIGYDEKKSLGEKETGARAALPIWMQFMSVALAGKDPGEFQPAPAAVDSAVAQKKVDTPDVAPGDGELH
jgi:penicillin-binding protein 1A